MAKILIEYRQAVCTGGGPDGIGRSTRPSFFLILVFQVEGRWVGAMKLLETGTVSMKALVKTLGSDVSVRRDLGVRFMRCMDCTASARQVLRDTCSLGSCQVFGSCVCWQGARKGEGHEC